MKTHPEQYVDKTPDLKGDKFSDKFKQLQKNICKRAFDYSIPYDPREPIPHMSAIPFSPEAAASANIPNGSVWTLDSTTFFVTYHSLTVDALQLLECWTARNAIYQLCREFGEQLHTVPLDIPCDLVPPADETVLIHFPDTVRFRHNDGTYARCAYVRQRSGGEEVVRDIACNRTLRILMPDYDEDGRLLDTFSWLSMPMRSGYTLTQEAEEVRKINCDPAMGSSVDVLDYVAKAYLYIKSGEPDLRALRAPKEPETRKAKKLRHFHRVHADTSLLDVTLVGYDFKKKTQYNVGETCVRGFFRTQRYGKNWSKYKIIWIDEHTRTYSKRTQDAGTTNA